MSWNSWSNDSNFSYANTNTNNFSYTTENYTYSCVQAVCFNENFHYQLMYWLLYNICIQETLEKYET